MSTIAAQPAHLRHSPRMHVIGRRFGAHRAMRGFSMIEVLIALLILAGGLLGFALLQTMNIRFTQSANYRTQATNLAYELIDQIRANRTSTGQFVQGITPGSFSGVDGYNCTPDTGASTVTDTMNGWRCRVVAALGEDATANVTQPNLGQIHVEIEWDDERWTNTTKKFEVDTEL